MTRILAADTAAIAQAAAILKEGGLVAMPTETVYGLAANALDGRAVAKVYAAKGRPQFNPLIAHFADVPGAVQHAEFDARAHLLAQKFWPGPLTLVLPRTPPLSPPHAGGEQSEAMLGGRISSLATAGLDTIAVRVPAHPAAQQLIRACGFPLVAPSANPSTGLSPTTPLHVAQGLGAAVDMILAAGPCAIGLESTVIDLSGPEAVLLRPGAITAQQIEDALQQKVLNAAKDSLLKAPGMMEKHYAPGVKLRLRAVDVMPGEALLAFGSLRFMGLRGGGAAAGLPETRLRNLSESSDLHEAAANLFAMLHDLDRPEHSAIAVMDIPETGLGIAINDRLRRGAAT